MSRLESMRNENGSIEDILQDFKKSIKDTNNKYILKLKSFEEFMFGEFPVGTYEAVRALVREYETVKLILMKYSRDTVSPNVTQFPPLIYIPENQEFKYSTLLQQYFDLFPASSIIYRILPKPALQEYWFNKPMDRIEKLTKYTESGECDFPFYVNVKGIKDLFALKYHIDCKAYNEGGMDLPYFPRIPSLEKLKMRKNILQTIWGKIGNLCKDKETIKKQKEANQQEHEQHEHEKQVKSMAKKYKENLELLDKLNYIKVGLSKQKTEKQFLNLITGANYIKLTDERLKYLQTDLNSRIHDKKNHLFRRLKDEENFTLNNYKLPFLPSLIRMEIIMLYGSYEIQKQNTRFFIINNDININEKVNFPKLLISHLPRETRVAINLHAYDKSQNSKKSFILGSCCSPLYDANGIMVKKLAMNIWPLVAIDPRIICTYDYMGKYYQKEGEKSNEFDKKKFCTLYIEFPSLVRNMVYTLKTPYSYREFLKIKYSKDYDNVNNTYEMKLLYVNSMEHLEQLIDNLRNRDNVNDKKKDDGEKKVRSVSKKKKRKKVVNDEDGQLLDDNKLVYNVLI
jgi:hypothetical protein